MSTDQETPRGRGRRGKGAGRCAGQGGGGRAGLRGPFRRSVLEAAILASLVESETHGYDLVEQIGSLAGDQVCIDPGSMYRLLRAMEDEGLISSTWQTAEAGPSRRVYVVTANGVEALERMADELSGRAAALERLSRHARKTAEQARRNDAAKERPA